MKELPDIINRLPEADLPFPTSTAKTGVLSNPPHGQVVFFQIFKDVEIPAHAHKGQWGVVIEGELELTVNGSTSVHNKGSSYFIPAGAIHSGKVRAGTIAIEFFEESDRYKTRS